MRLDPDVVAPADLLAQLKEIEALGRPASTSSFSTRVIDVPAYYDDPWTREVLMRFRDQHQAPEGTDLEYVTRINGFETEQEFIEAHHGSPYYVSMVGFVPGLPWCFQMVAPRAPARGAEVPAAAHRHAGARALARRRLRGDLPGAGPRRLPAVRDCPVPIFDPKEELPDFQDSFVMFRVGRHPQDPARRPRGLRRDPRRGRGEDYRYRMVDVEFEPQAFFADPEAYNAELVQRLYA